MTATWIEPPPKQRRTGCLGKGCMMLVVFLILLAVAFFVGGYVGVRYVVTSEKPKQIQVIETTESEQAAVKQRWDEFTKGPQSAPAETPVPDPNATPSTEPAPMSTPVANRIELTAS